MGSKWEPRCVLPPIPVPIRPLLPRGTQPPLPYCHPTPHMVELPCACPEGRISLFPVGICRPGNSPFWERGGIDVPSPGPRLPGAAGPLGCDLDIEFSDWSLQTSSVDSRPSPRMCSKFDLKTWSQHFKISLHFQIVKPRPGSTGGGRCMQQHPPL